MSLEKLQKFCSTRDKRFLADLDRPIETFLRIMSVEALKIPTANHELAKIILKSYNRDENGLRIYDKPFDKKVAEDLLKTMSISLTGARVDDTIIGCELRSKGTVLKLHSTNVPPEQRKLDFIRHFQDLWERFLTRLGSIEYFGRMSVIEREIWLDLNEFSGKYSIGDQGTRIEFVQPGIKYLPETLSQDQLDLLVNGNQKSADGYWSIDEILNMLPNGSMFLYPSGFQIIVEYEIVRATNNIVIDIETGKMLDDIETKVSQDREIYLFGSVTNELSLISKRWQRSTELNGTQTIGLLVSNRDQFSWNRISNFLEKDFRVPIESQLKIQEHFNKFSPSSFKSLIQKIIRFGANQIDFGNGYVESSRNVLLVSMAELVKHPGSFVPDIQRFVTGLESFGKRMAIIILEDSFIKIEHQNVLLSLVSYAMFAQRTRGGVRPSKEVLINWFNTGLEALESRVAVEQKHREYLTAKPYVVARGQSELKTVSAIIDELRSFDTDLALARAWANECPNFTFQKGNMFPEIMRFGQCVDQHWSPSMAYYFNVSFVNAVSQGYNPGKPFEKLFGYIWDKSSSINPRRMDFNSARFVESTKEIVKAQRLLLIALQVIPCKREVTDKHIDFQYTLDDSWIAGLIGTIDIKLPKDPNMIVTLDANNPLQLLAIRKPSRGMAQEKVSDDIQDRAIQRAKGRLLHSHGIKMNQADPPYQGLSNAYLVLVENNEEDPFYCVRKGNSNKLIPWEQARQIELTFPIHPKSEIRTIEYALSNIGDGIEEDSNKTFSELLSNTDLSIVRRALSYLTTFKGTIELNRISRDGSGTYQAVVLEDVGAYHFLIQLSLIYPIAIRPYGPGRFSIPMPPLLWEIKSNISNYLLSLVGADTSGWNTISFEDPRPLWNHQTEIVDLLLKQYNTGTKGSFIWQTVGSGKTAIVLSYLGSLKRQEQLSKYILYTLPQTAINSIINEILLYGVPVNLIIPLADIKTRKQKYSKQGVNVISECRLESYAINLIEHDHARRCENKLLAFMPETFLVVDETHKALNDTKRTSVLLNFAKLSRHFIALTGTAIIDDKTYKLIPWLELIVKYAVNSNNFFVAASSMINQQIDTGVKVDVEEISAIFTDQEYEIYRRMAPPNLDGINVNPSQSEMLRATNICYETASREMVSETLDLLDQNIGVMVVAKDAAHQELLYERIIATNRVIPADIYILQAGMSIHLTDETVEVGTTPDYKIVIVSIRKSEGYTLTRLGSMVTSVYPSNQANRIQIAGRINRLSQQRLVIYHKIVHCGILTAILRNHNLAKNLEQALKDLAKTSEI